MVEVNAVSYERPCALRAPVQCWTATIGASMIEREDIQQHTLPAIHDLIRACGGDPESFDGSLITQLIQSSLKLIPAPGNPEAYDTGQIKLITAALKEMRYAYRVFNKYRGIRKVTIFGSARTPPEHLDYHAARIFSAAIAQHGWMVIT